MPPFAYELVSDTSLIATRLKEYYVSEALADVIVNAMLPAANQRTQCVSDFLAQLSACQSSDATEKAKRAPAENEETRIIDTKSEETEIIQEPVASASAAIAVTSASSTSSSATRRPARKRTKRFWTKKRLARYARNIFCTLLVLSACYCGYTKYQRDKIIDNLVANMVEVENSNGVRSKIGKALVTQEEWQAVMGSIITNPTTITAQLGMFIPTRPHEGLNPSCKRGAKLPVECVTWNDCQVFMSKLNKITGRIFRLPSKYECDKYANTNSDVSNEWTSERYDYDNRYPSCTYVRSVTDCNQFTGFRIAESE